MSKNLKNDAVKSIKWTTSQTIIGGVLGPISLWIRSIFLSPEEFGYLSIILIVIGLFSLFENFGISQAIIQKGAITKQESSSIFFFNILFTAILALIVYLLGKPLAIFYELPELDFYLKSVSVIVFLNGPSFLFRAFLEKEIYFKQLSLINISRNVINVLAIFGFLYYDFGVLGVIYAYIVSTAIATFLIILKSLRLTHVKINLYFQLKKLYPFLRFGVFVSGKQLLTYAANRLDELVIGYFLTPDILGIYHFGKQMLEKLRTLLTNSFSKVLFPVFSKLKNEKEQLSNVYLKVSKYLAYIAFPVFTGIAVTAHLFVPLVFGEQWVDSIIVFQVFSVSMIFFLLTSNVSGALLYSVNKPAIVFNIDLLINSIYFIVLFLFTSQGLIVVLIIYSIYIIVKTSTLQFFANKQLTYKMNTYLSLLKRPFIFSIIMGLIIWLFQFFMKTHFSNALILIFSIIIGATFYLISIFINSRQDYFELLGLLKKEKTIMK
ncbi:MAG: lipopolysaccharide biosynthesis protein [bacterium]